MRLELPCHKEEKIVPRLAGGDLGRQLDEGLAADQEERERLRAKWEPRYLLIREWRQFCLSVLPISAFSVLSMLVAAIGAVVYHHAHKAEWLKIDYEAVIWYYACVQVGTGLALLALERLCIWHAERIGVDLSRHVVKRHRR